MTYFELKKMLAEHQAWLADSKEGVRADLSGANLAGAHLQLANLAGAIFAPGWVINKAPKVERIL